MKACCAFFKQANPRVRAKLLEEIVGEVQLDYLIDFVKEFVHDMDKFCPACGGSLIVKQNKGLPEPVKSSNDNVETPRKPSCRYCKGTLKDGQGQCKGCLGTGDDRKGIPQGSKSIG